jgi:hypothetical protein
MPEHRRHKRYNVGHGARIALADGQTLGGCHILDISARGARLHVSSVEEVPTDFVLLLSHDGSLKRQCLVAWRKEHTVGVEFVKFDPGAGK